MSKILELEMKKQLLEEKEKLKQKELEAKEKLKQKELEEKELKKQKDIEEKELKKQQKQKEIEENELKNAQKELDKQQKILDKEKQRQKLNDTIDNQYLEMKREVEKEWFIVKDLGQFAKYDKTRNKFIIHNEKATKLNLSTYNLDVATKFGITKSPFFDKWIKDPNRREYDSIVFDPQQKNKNDFNTFTGFKHDNTENPKKSTKTIHKLLDHLFRPKYKKYILEWLSYIIKAKDKTNVCIVLYSDAHGVGKNSFIELIRKLIDEKYVSKLENIDELQSQFNSFCESKFIIYGDEILAKTKDLYTTLKNTITRSQVKINKKGIDAYEMENYTNYLFTTNERCPFKIEKNDRRMTMLETTEIKLSKELTKEFYEAIKDENIIKTFYHELLDFDTPEEIECLRIIS